MTHQTHHSANWFENGGEDYARYRPEYPAAVVDFLASLTAEPAHALDVGCGTGQLAQHLAQKYAQVTGLDPSSDQIKNATPHPRIHYRIAAAEHLPDDISNINLVTVAQAAHWFDLPAFYREVRRIAAPNAVIALISYGVLEPDAEIRARFQQFYSHEIGPFWPPERKLVDDGYAGIYFPFEEIRAPKMEIRLEWDLHALMGYISTWSAVKRARDAGREDMLTTFYRDLSAIWGNPAELRTFVWPVNIKTGML